MRSVTAGVSQFTGDKRMGDRRRSGMVSEWDMTAQLVVIVFRFKWQRVRSHGWVICQVAREDWQEVRVDCLRPLGFCQ
jgi:hypothetical protein